MRGWFQVLGDLVFPRACAGCGCELDGDGVTLCWECLSLCEFIRDPFCVWCGDPVLGEVGHAYTCGWCRRRVPGFCLARSAVRFRGGVREALHALKYGGACAVARDLGALLHACVACHYVHCVFDAVVAVPLHPARLRARSYNQSALLAAELSGRLGVPFRPAVLSRLRPTPTQTSLTARERSRNVRGAFASDHPRWVAGRRFLLVDDVVTTGATVSEASWALKEAGAVSVHVVSVARG
jgi:ComF family protein